MSDLGSRDTRVRSEGPLFATEPVAPAHRSPPVVVVGLPRSGSSYLSHVISCIGDWFVFDDLYILRQADALRATGPLTRRQLESLIDFLSWQLRARIKLERNFLKIHCSLEDVDRMETALLQTFQSTSATWYELLEEWLVRLALHHGRNRWGYKTPQDFMHMPRLARLFPGIRFIFLVRNPANMMASYKYVNPLDGSRGQYHPLVYARYWALASRMIRKYERELDLPVYRVRFEALVADPDAEARKIAGFLGSSPPESIPKMGANTSFRNGPRHAITSTEAWICQRIAGEEMRLFGYECGDAHAALSDLPDLFATSLRFGTYQLRRFTGNSGARRSIVRFLRSVRESRER